MIGHGLAWITQKGTTYMHFTGEISTSYFSHIILGFIHDWYLVHSEMMGAEKWPEKCGKYLFVKRKDIIRFFKGNSP